MNRQTLEVFHGLMKKGWIDRQDDAALWALAEETDIQEELEDFKAVLGFDLLHAGNRLYLIPNQDNDLFLQSNLDYRRDIHAGRETRKQDLYLLNYMSIYLIYLFFGGDSNDPQCREFISKEEFVRQFTEHCKLTESQDLAENEDVTDYSENFKRLANVWLSKITGEPESQKFETKYGCLNRILVRCKKEEIFDVNDDGLIRPTRKMKDLMPYFLRKERITEIHNWIKEGEANAENQ